MQMFYITILADTISIIYILLLILFCNLNIIYNILLILIFLFLFKKYCISRFIALQIYYKYFN